MSRLSAILIRSSLLALISGGALGAWLLSVEPGSGVWVARFRSAHVHLMLFGWLLPFVLGTAYWILPKHATNPARGSPAVGAIAAGLVLGGAVLGTLGALEGSTGVQGAGTLIVLTGAASFIGLLWPRVRAFGVGRPISGSGPRP